MCAKNDPDELAKLKRRKGPIAAWKVLSLDGNPLYHNTKFLYGPGTVVVFNVPERYGALDSYGFATHGGIHVYRNKRAARNYEAVYRLYNRRLLKVLIDPEDLIAAEPASNRYSQLVAKKITITTENWDAAGFPKRANRKRRI